MDRQNSETLYYADDEDGNRKKYSRRGERKNLLYLTFLVFKIMLCVCFTTRLKLRICVSLTDFFLSFLM